MTIYFISDYHFNHKNILNFEDRPFLSIGEMEESIINTWNKTVSNNDTVHYLGDFCFGGYEKYKEILEQLNGKIIFYKGNHDKGKVLKRLYKEGYFEELYMLGNYMKLRSPKTKTRYQLHLSHYPIEIGHRRNMYSLHGHIHAENSKMINQINLCADSPLNFNREFGKPVSEHELIQYLDSINPQLEKLFHKERENR